ncbi:MAG: M55 family metallopeptidase [Clostridia bacterium]|nr:M55 family metallopeptidase [Clostridia bacterium]
MRIIVMTDLEGIAGVDSYEMIASGNEEDYTAACRALMSDLNAAVRGYFDAGAEAVYVYDGHGRGKNFIRPMLDPRAVQLDNEDFHTLVKSGGIDAYAEIGLHAMAGTENAFLEHTQSSKTWFDYRINGVSCGEFVQGAAFVGEFGIPFIFVSGDGAACEEAKRFVPDIATAVVKQAEGRNKAVSLSREAADRLIYETAKASVKRIGSIRPYKIALPAEITLTLQRTDYCDDLAKRYERTDARTVRRITERIERYADLLFP